MNVSIYQSIYNKYNTIPGVPKYLKQFETCTRESNFMSQANANKLYNARSFYQNSHMIFSEIFILSLILQSYTGVLYAHRC